jgi:hypothetical protein
VRRARRVGRPAAPARCHQEALATAAQVEDAVQSALPSAEAASGAQQPAGGGKKDKERQRKERQRQRRMEEAKEALQVAIEAMADARCVSPLWLMCM